MRLRVGLSTSWAEARQGRGAEGLEPLSDASMLSAQDLPKRSTSCDSLFVDFARVRHSARQPLPMRVLAVRNRTSDEMVLSGCGRSAHRVCSPPSACHTDVLRRPLPFCCRFVTCV